MKNLVVLLNRNKTIRRILKGFGKSVYQILAYNSDLDMIIKFHIMVRYYYDLIFILKTTYLTIL
jgi:hypothetical protein